MTRRDQLVERVVAGFERTHCRSPERLIAAPGRVNLIGEHCDYNDCHVLPAAIDYETIVAIGAGDNGAVKAVATDYGDACDEFDPAQPFVSQDEEWKNHLRGVAASLEGRGFAADGVNLAIGGNVPQGAGLSSSASVNVAIAKAFAEQLSYTKLSPTDFAQIAQQSENDYVGCACGIMDQLVSARAEDGAALLIDCRTLDTKPIVLPNEWSILVVHSGVQRELASSAFNERRAQCEAAASQCGVPALRDLSLDRLLTNKGNLDDVIFRRARHVVTENLRVLDAIEAIAAKDIPALSHLMAASHLSLKDDFEVTVPAVDGLVEMASDILGDAGGVRMTGGGFGGCIVAVAPAILLAELKKHLDQKYRAPDGTQASTYACHPSVGASVV